MACITVSPQALEALAVALVKVADDLAGGAADGRERAWSLGAGDSSGALTRVLGDFEHQRLLLGRSTADLSAAVRAAGRAYVEVDESVVVEDGG